MVTYEISMKGSGKASLGSARRKFHVQCSALTSWGMFVCIEYVRTLEGRGGYSGFSPFFLELTARVGVNEEWGSGFKGCDNHISFVDN
jgi:hypothetical protein